MVKNKHYRAFLDMGVIETLSEIQIQKALENIKGIYGKYIKEARSLVILLYYSGARPNEILKIKGKDITKDGSYLRVLVKGSKKGLPRTLFFQLKKPMIKELYEYSLGVMPEMFLFFHYMSNYVRERKTKRGDKQYIEISNRLRYWFNIWFDGVMPGNVIPYYLRHNRMSKLAMNDASMQEMRMIKGSRTYESVIPYLHMSSKISKKIAKKID